MILGVDIADDKIFCHSSSVCPAIDDVERTDMALLVLRTHGLNNAALQQVYPSAVPSASISDRPRPTSRNMFAKSPNVWRIVSCDAEDDKLFDKAIRQSNHVLRMSTPSINNCVAMLQSPTARTLATVAGTLRACTEAPIRLQLLYTHATNTRLPVCWFAISRSFKFQNFNVGLRSVIHAINEHSLLLLLYWLQGIIFATGPECRHRIVP